MFQYIICHWFKEQENNMADVILRFQYIICHWFNSRCDFDGEIIEVSIHYMSLVQARATEARMNYTFQYIICHWFNKATKIQLRANVRFQYIICHWFNSTFGASKSVLQKFQYIICHWFKTANYWIRFVYYVSIHYMSLVQHFQQVLQLHLFCFNTLYVIGSRYIISKCLKRN